MGVVKKIYRTRYIFSKSYFKNHVNGTFFLHYDSTAWDLSIYLLLGNGSLGIGILKRDNTPK